MKTLDEVLKAHVLTVFLACRRNVTVSAKVLGISRATMYRWLNRFTAEELKEPDGT